MIVQIFLVRDTLQFMMKNMNNKMNINMNMMNQNKLMKTQLYNSNQNKRN